MTVALSPLDPRRARSSFRSAVGETARRGAVDAWRAAGLDTLKNKQLVQNLSNNAAPIEVVVSLDRDAKTPSGYAWSSSRGPTSRSTAARLTQADVRVRDMPLLSLVIPPLRQLWTSKS